MDLVFRHPNYLNDFAWRSLPLDHPNGTPAYAECFGKQHLDRMVCLATFGGCCYSDLE